tara:strand:- start:1889 stop:4249 length:2361 start_codon:yes stop_codon:yes gene_type:complete
MADNIKISQLDELASGSLQDSTIFPVVDGGTTKQTALSSLQAYLTDDLATDTELSTQISNVNSTITGLTTANIGENSSNKYYTDARVKTKLNSEGVFSGSNFTTAVSESAAASGFGQGGGGGASAYSDLTSIPNGILSSSLQISSLGYIEQANIDSTFIGERLPQGLISGGNQIHPFLKYYGSGITITSASQGGINYLTFTNNGGGGGGASAYSDLTDIPNGIISQSGQLDRDLLNFFGGDNHVTITSSSVFGPLNITISVDTGSSGGGGGSSDYISNVVIADGELTFTGVGSAFNNSIDFSNQGFITGGADEIGGLGFLTESNAIAVLPDGLISSSEQIDITLAQVTNNGSSSTETLFVGGLSIGTGDPYSFPTVDGINGQYLGTDGNGNITFSSPGGGGGTDWTIITNVPAGIISSSNQVLLTNADGTGFDTTFVNENTSSENLYYNNERVLSYLNSLEVFSSSMEATLPFGVLSSSLQIDYQQLQNKRKLIAGDQIEIISSSNYVIIQAQLSSSANTIVEDFNSFTASYEFDKLSFISSSEQIEELGFNRNAGDVSQLNIWTGSGGEFGGFSASIANQIADLETGSVTDDINDLLGKSLISESEQVDYIRLSNLPNYFSPDGTITFTVLDNQITASAQLATANFAATSASNTFFQPQTISSSFLVHGDNNNNVVRFEDTSRVEVNNTDLLVSGGVYVSGSVTADEFIVGDSGTPSISSANNLEISASLDINMIAQEVNINDVLVLTPRTTNPTSPSSGSIITSGSGATIKPYFWDGNSWNALY